MLPTTEIVHLQTFVTASEAGSVAAAAAQLSTGQASISRRLRQLEDNLGAKLFERSAQGLELTPEGERFLLDAKEILAGVEAATADVRRFGSSTAGTIRIGLPPIALKFLASGLVRYALNEQPDAMISFHEGYSGDVQEWLEGGKIDIGLFYSDPGTGPAFARPVAVEELHLVGVGVSDMAVDGSVPVGKIFELPLVLPGAPHGHRLQIEQLAARERAKLNVAVEVNSLGALLGALAAGVGYALLPLEALPPDAERLGLSVARFSGAPLTRVLMMGTSSRRAESRLTRIFLPVIEALYDIKQGRAAKAASPRWESYLIEEPSHYAGRSAPP